MHITFTGGGSGGHVMPIIALLRTIRTEHPEVRCSFVGSYRGIERQLIAAEHVSYYPILTGKLRRYFSLWTLIDAVKVPLGILQSLVILLWLRPHVVFSKGGYVSLPVTIAAWVLRIPVVIHEADIEPGLANRIAAKFAAIIALSSEESRPYVHHEHVHVTGLPVRAAIASGSRAEGYRLTGFSPSLPVLLCTGGGLGADALNAALEAILPDLLPHVQVIHLTGMGKLESVPLSQFAERYYRRPFATEDLPHLFAITDLALSRGGAVTLAEFAALAIPAIVVPLKHGCSRGEQFRNAELFTAHYQGWILPEEEFVGSPATLLRTILAHRERRTPSSASLSSILHTHHAIIDLLFKAAGQRYPSS